jgi:hypothetical protein
MDSQIHGLSMPLAFLLGCIGALAEEIVRLYGRRVRIHRLRFSWGYLVISLVYSALGGVVALVLPATTPLAAFYAGMGCPAIITSAARKGYIEFSNERPGPIQCTRPSRWAILKSMIRSHADGF